MRLTLGATAQRRHRLDMMPTSLTPKMTKSFIFLITETKISSGLYALFGYLPLVKKKLYDDAVIMFLIVP
jgi:hypothetical protein